MSVARCLRSELAAWLAARWQRSENTFDRAKQLDRFAGIAARESLDETARCISLEERMQARMGGGRERLVPSSGNLLYDKASRAYHAGPKYKPAFEGTTAEQFLRQRLLDATAPRPDSQDMLVVTMPLPTRGIALAILRPLWRAIQERKGVRVLYQSLTKPEAQLRTLSPHALAHDGFRWHVRAYCHERRDFRDFVIARILKIEATVAAGLGAAEDEAWNTYATLVLTPNPNLNKAHQRAIELDYGMVQGKVGLRCRKAMLFYALHHLRLDELEAAPEARQIVLKNAEQIARIMRHRSRAQ